MSRVLLGIRGAEDAQIVGQIVQILAKIEGVEKAEQTQPGQIQVDYNPHLVTTMDLIRAIREQGFLAGIL